MNDTESTGLRLDKEALLKEHREHYLESRQADVLEHAGFKVTQTKNMLYCVEDAIISETWRIGGLTGGSCWGSDADIPVSADRRPNWLEDFIEATCPDISFRTFKRLREAVTEHQFTRNEYYGNYTEYAFEVLKISTFLEILGDDKSKGESNDKEIASTASKRAR
jgi:hypothetical protein